MNAKLLGFFSGFPTHHFPVAIAERLREELAVRDSLVFISAWPLEYGRNDSDASGMHAMFQEYDMQFKKYSVIDNRTHAPDAINLIRQASCIFLMGGDSIQQIHLINEKGISDEICKSSAVILGLSADSYNMAVNALDILESPVPYRGLGLADITIKAHVNRENRALLQTLSEISLSQALPICAMEDESAIFVKDNTVEHIGNILWLSECQIDRFSPELLNI